MKFSPESNYQAYAPFLDRWERLQLPRSKCITCKAWMWSVSVSINLLGRRLAISSSAFPSLRKLRSVLIESEMPKPLQMSRKHPLRNAGNAHLSVKSVWSGFAGKNEKETTEASMFYNAGKWQECSSDGTWTWRLWITCLSEGDFIVIEAKYQLKCLISLRNQYWSFCAQKTRDLSVGLHDVKLDESVAFVELV